MASPEASLNISNFFRTLSGTFLIAGTTIGAGMLGIPLVTAEAGFLPATVVTLICWLFMLATGLLCLEVTLWMPEGSNIVSMAARFLGRKGKYLAGGMFLFYYYCLMVAYFAAGAPMLCIGGVLDYVVLGVVFGAVVFWGAKVIDRTNLVLTVGLILAYFFLIGLGAVEVKTARLQTAIWSNSFIALPLLFSAFGYHNIIPSLRTYMRGDRKTLRLSIIFGTTIPLIVYLAWQWLFIGAVPEKIFYLALSEGRTATEALQLAVNNPWIFLTARLFAFFAITTSMLGVAFSLVDFLSDATKKKNNLLFTAVTFIPPFLFALFDPTIFDRALGYAGGFGGAFLNGLLPITLVWLGRYREGLFSKDSLFGGKWLLRVLFAFGLFVMGVEAYYALS